MYIKNKSKRCLIKGFTLVELLAVIVILAIILVIAVPKVMSVIEDSKKATLESTTKMIASTAEKQKVQNTVLGNNETITCDSVAKTNDADYEDCDIDFDENTAKVTIKGDGKFEGLWVCDGTKTSATAQKERCLKKVLLIVDLNYGIDNVDYESMYLEGSTVMLTEPTKEGYTFNGWTVTGTDASVNGNTLIIGSETTTVTATWKVFVAYGDGNTYIADLLANENELKNGLLRTYATYTNDNGEEITIDAGIRYVGSLTGDNAVKNQVYFNCEDKDANDVEYGNNEYDYENNCEIWRIIGVFNTKEDVNDTNGTPRIKIINTNSTFTASWDSSENSTSNTVNDGWGVNQWSSSKLTDGTTYAGADLFQLLSGYYIGKTGSKCKYNNTMSMKALMRTCDTETDKLKDKNMKPLTTIAMGMINKAVWYSYGINSPIASTSYLQERGITKKYTGCQKTETTKCTNDNVVRNNVWTGLVGLMSLSDKLYAEGWLNSSDSAWTITPFSLSSASHSVYYSSETSGNISKNSKAYLPRGVWPSVYLSSNIQIIGGDGSTNNPYKLS